MKIHLGIDTREIGGHLFASGGSTPIHNDDPMVKPPAGDLDQGSDQMGVTPTGTFADFVVTQGNNSNANERGYKDPTTGASTGPFGSIDKVEIELVARIKEWFNSKPNYLVLTNASILYHKIFLKMSPVGAFKYNSRNKNCIIFLEDETRLGNRLYFDEVGNDDYYDQDIRDILMVDINDIDDVFVKQESRTIISVSLCGIKNFYNRIY